MSKDIKNTPIYIESALEFQIDENIKKAQNDKEKIKYNKILHNFSLNYIEYLNKCKDEYSRFKDIEEYNINADISKSESYSTYLNSLDNCTNGYASQFIYLQGLKSFGENVIESYKEYCLNDCERIFKQNNNEKKNYINCSKNCVKNLYNIEKALEKELYLYVSNIQI